jgi:hypothetical protein
LVRLKKGRVSTGYPEKGKAILSPDIEVRLATGGVEGAAARMNGFLKPTDR